MLNLSANLGFLWTDRPLPAAIAAAGAAGFRAVELHWPYDLPAESIREAADAAGVRILALNTVRGDVAAGEFGMACLPGRAAEFEASVAQAVSYAQVLGAGAIHVMAGCPVDDDWRSRLVAAMRRAADHAAQSDITVLLEPLNAVDNPGYAYATIAEADAIRQAIDRPNVRLMLDAYHEARGGLDPADAWDTYRDVIGHIQIAGVPGRDEPRVDEAPLAGLINRLDRSGYGGWIGCEYRPAADTDDGLNWRAALPGWIG